MTTAAPSLRGRGTRGPERREYWEVDPWADPGSMNDEERREAQGKPSASGGLLTAKLEIYGRRRNENLTARPSSYSETSAGRRSAKPAGQRIDKNDPPGGN